MYKTRTVKQLRGFISRIAGISFRLCAMIGVCAIVLTVFPIDNWIAERLAGRWVEPPGNVLIVLGGGKFDDDIIGESSYIRAANALRAERRDHFQKIVILGGSQQGVAVSLLMRNFLLSNGISPDQIVTETTSQSTHENALYGKPLLDSIPGTKVLMTSDYHVYRAVRVFRKQGINVQPWPVNDVERRQTRLSWRLPLFGELMLETAKILYYRVRGWI